MIPPCIGFRPKRQGENLPQILFPDHRLNRSIECLRPEIEEDGAVEIHGWPRKNVKIPVADRQFADSQAVQLKKVLLQGSLHCHRSSSRVLPFEFQDHRPSTQDGAAQTREDTIPRNSETLDVDAVVFAWNLPEATQVAVSTQTL